MWNGIGLQHNNKQSEVMIESLNGIKVIPLYSILSHPYFQKIVEITKKALEYFPEIKMPVYLAIQTRDDTKARVDQINQIIFWHHLEEPTYMTGFHEMAHIAVWRHNMLAQIGEVEKWPNTEEFASILAVSRMPPELIDEDRIPYIGNIKGLPKHIVPLLCKGALKYRETKRNYIQFLRKRIKESLFSIALKKNPLYGENYVWANI